MRPLNLWESRLMEWWLELGGHLMGMKKLINKPKRKEKKGDEGIKWWWRHSPRRRDWYLFYIPCSAILSPAAWKWNQKGKICLGPAVAF